MNSVLKHLFPGPVLFGPGALDRLADELPPEPAYLIVTDPGVARAGLADRLEQSLRRAGRKYHCYDQTPADPPIEAVEAAVALARETGCEAVIGLGGGSALDAAKAAAVRLTHDQPLRVFGDGLWAPGPVAPLYAVPTTAGTGSEATRVAVITDAAKKEKMAIRGVHLAPQLAVLDPDVLASLPSRIAAETGADALTHAVEAFLSRAASPFTDALALAAIEGITANLRAFVARPAHAQAALAMLVGSHLAGQAFSNASVGLAHSFGEPLGAYCHVSHGLACALFLPHVLDFCRPAAVDRLAALARALGVETRGLTGEDAGLLAVQAVKRLWADVGLPLGYQAAGIDFHLHPQMIADVGPQYSTRMSPRIPNDDEARALYLAPANLPGPEPATSKGRGKAVWKRF